MGLLGRKVGALSVGSGDKDYQGPVTAGETQVIPFGCETSGIDPLGFAAGDEVPVLVIAAISTADIGDFLSPRGEIPTRTDGVAWSSASSSFPVSEKETRAKEVFKERRAEERVKAGQGLQETRPW